jgi:hypothetical protein
MGARVADKWKSEEELDEITRQSVVAHIGDYWASSYMKAYQLLLSDKELDKEETHFLVKRGFLSIQHLPNPPHPEIFDDIHILAFQALDAGRLWPYDLRVRALKKWQRENAAI